MTRSPLQGLEIVITRPQGQAEPLLHQLRAIGSHPVHIPLIAILPLTSPAQQLRIQTSLQQLSLYQHAIFISQNAAHQAWLALTTYQQKWPADIQTYAVGRSTAFWLQQHDITASTPERMDSEGLLALPALQSVQGQRCIIFRGLGGRETLAQGLRGRGMQVDYCELYRRRLPTQAPTDWIRWREKQDACTGRAPRAAIVSLNSVETLDNLLAIDEHCTRLKNVHWLVPGERVARAAHARGFRHIITAPDALDETVLETIQQWCNAQ